MTDGAKLPTKVAPRGVTVPVERRSCLISRGLAAIQTRAIDTPVELNKENQASAGADDDDDSIEEWREAAELGDAEAQYELSAMLCEKGEKVDAEYWLMCSADLGYGPAQLLYADLVDADEAVRLIQLAGEWYKIQAETGDPVWQYEYALLLLRDDDEWCGDPDEGMRWLIASAQQDCVRACVRLASEYLKGKISEQTTQQGVFWLSRAADLGDTWACELLGDLYLLGHSHGEYAVKRSGSPPRRIEPNHKLAVAWYRRGIAKGTPMSKSIAFILGRHYLTGEHLERDLQLAEKWLVHSATKKLPQAQQLLGEEYASGARLRQDTDAAIYWLALAGGSSREARLKLAEIYLEGRLISRSFGQALKWLMLDPENRGKKNREMKLVAQKCFDGRFSTAEESAAHTWLVEMAIITKDRATTTEPGYGYLDYFSLAELYELGLGLEHDMQKAIYWYRQAAEHGHYSAKTRLEKLGVDWKVR